MAVVTWGLVGVVGCAQSALLLRLSLLLEFISLTGEGTEIKPSPLNATRSAPHLRLSVDV
jgi:hypothetical protein